MNDIITTAIFTMTDKLKRSLSLSKTKKKGNAKTGTNTTPITSFFNSPQPSKLACPLCGQMVPRFRINEHIDLQCQSFERGDSNAPSASNSVVQSVQLSPKNRKTTPRTPPKTPPKKEEEEKASQTSPYFKKNNSQQVPREISSKTVVRTINLGSLSSKLSRKYQKTPERTATEDKHASSHTDKEKDCSEALNSSQKENLLVQTLEDKRDSVTVIDLTSSPETSAANLSSLEKSSVCKLVTPNLLPSSSKLAKRKKEATSKSKVGKKAKYEGSSKETETVSTGGVTVETPDVDAHKTEAPSTTCSEPLSSSEETYKKDAASISSDLPSESGAKETISNQADESLPPQRLPYYLRNFQTVLHAVLENEDDRELFNQDDMSLVETFQKLSGMFKCHLVIVGSWSSKASLHFHVLFLSQSKVRSFM